MMCPTDLGASKARARYLLDVVEIIAEACGLKDRLPWMVIPRYFGCKDGSRGDLLSFNVGGQPVSIKLLVRKTNLHALALRFTLWLCSPLLPSLWLPAWLLRWEGCCRGMCCRRTYPPWVLCVERSASYSRKRSGEMTNPDHR